MTQIELIFLKMTSNALQEEDSSFDTVINNEIATLTPDDWDTLRVMAFSQNVPALVFDVIKKISKTNKVPSETLAQNEMHLRKMQQINTEMNGIIAKMCRRLSDNGLKIILFKGQTLAARYPKPLCRSCGNIDILTCGNLDEVESFLFYVNDFSLVYNPIHGDTIMLHDDYNIEIHHCLLHAYNPRALKFFRNYKGTPNKTILIGNEPVLTLPPELEITYLTGNIIHKTIHNWITLKHICDWMMVLKSEYKTMDKVLLDNYLNKTQYKKTFIVLNALCVDYLGLSESYMLYRPTDRDYKSVSIILTEILKEDDYELFMSEDIKDKITVFFLPIKRILRYSSLFYLIPMEIFWAPFIKIVRFFNIKRIILFIKSKSREMFFSDDLYHRY